MLTAGLMGGRSGSGGGGRLGRGAGQARPRAAVARRLALGQAYVLFCIVSILYCWSDT